MSSSNYLKDYSFAHSYAKDGVIFASGDGAPETIVMEFGLHPTTTPTTYNDELVKLIIIGGNHWGKLEVIRNRLQLFEFGGNILEADVAKALHAGTQVPDTYVSVFTERAVYGFAYSALQGTIVASDLPYPETGRYSFKKDFAINIGPLQHMSLNAALLYLSHQPGIAKIDHYEFK